MKFVFNLCININKKVSGSYFGEIEIFLKSKREYDAICEVDCELYYISRYVRNIL